MVHGIREFLFTDILEYETWEGSINHVIGLPLNAQHILRTHAHDRQETHARRFGIQGPDSLTNRRFVSTSAPVNNARQISSLSIDELKSLIQTHANVMAEGKAFYLLMCISVVPNCFPQLQVSLQVWEIALEQP